MKLQILKFKDASMSDTNPLNHTCPFTAYKQVTYMLKRLMESSATAPSGDKPSSEGGLQAVSSPKEAVENVFSAALKSDDELFHVELYSWLLQVTSISIPWAFLLF